MSTTQQHTLHDQKALVTGATSGLGRAIAFQLARDGAEVIVHGRDAARGAETVDAIIAAGCQARFVAADLSNPADLRRLVADIGNIDILVNNAGGDIGAHTPRHEPNDALDIKAEDIRSVIERNLLTTMYSCKYAGLHMRQQRSGKIINVSSVAGHAPVNVGIIYAAAKAGISHYTRCLAEELRPFDVNVNCLAPASTYTGRFLARRAVPGEAGLPRLQRIAQPEDMARIVLFLASAQADYLTGETITCWQP